MNAQDTNAFVTECRTQATNLLLTLHKLRGLRNKFDALNLGQKMQDADIGGANESVTVADVTAVLGCTLEAFEKMLASGHATNLHQIALV